MIQTSKQAKKRRRKETAAKEIISAPRRRPRKGTRARKARKMTRPRLSPRPKHDKERDPLLLSPLVLAWLVGKAWKHSRRAANFIISLLSRPSFYRGSNSSRGERYLEAKRARGRR